MITSVQNNILEKIFWTAECIIINLFDFINHLNHYKKIVFNYFSPPNSIKFVMGCRKHLKYQN